MDIITSAVVQTAIIGVFAYWISEIGKDFYDLHKNKNQER